MKHWPLFLLLIFIVAITLFMRWCSHDYYFLYNIVEGEFEKMKDVKVLELSGNPDITLEDIYATIRTSRGDTLSFNGLFKSHFEDYAYITMYRFNKWNFHKTGCTGGGEWGSSSLDLGESSPYKEIRHLHLRNIRQVINHIEELRSIIQKIPVHPIFDTLQQAGKPIFIQKYSWKELDSRVLRWADCPPAGSVNDE